MTKRKRRIDALKNEIHTLEDLIANPPEVEDIDVIKADEVRTFPSLLAVAPKTEAVVSESK